MRKALLVAVILAMAVPALAQEATDVPRPKDTVIRFLELTPEQVTQWDAMLATLEETVAPLREQLRQVEQQLAEELKKETPDPMVVGTLVIQGKGLRVQIGEAHQGYVEAFQAMLTEEQLGKLAFLRRAERAVPLMPAFRLFGLLPPLPDPPGPRG
jgi:hypothetical protein